MKILISKYQGYNSLNEKNFKLINQIAHSKLMHLGMAYRIVMKMQNYNISI